MKLSIEKFLYGAEALAFSPEDANKMAVFVPLAVPGDLVEATLKETKKNYAIASLDKVLEPSPHRVAAPCPLFGADENNPGCGGCQWQMASYSYQLKAKKALVADALRRIGKFDAEKLPLKDCVGMEEPWRYRNKVQYPLQRGVKGQLLLGYYARKTHDIVDLETCPVELSIFDEILPRLKEFLSDPICSIYDEERHEGLLRHLCLRGSSRTKEALVILVSREPLPTALANRLASFDLAHVVGFAVNINPLKTNIIYGNQTQVLKGQGFYHEKVLGKTFRISATSFFQTNTDQVEKIVKRVVKGLPKNLDLALDAYCGVGLFSLFLADHAKKVIAIEEHPLSIEDAKANQRINNVNNVEWIASSVEKALNSIKEIPQLVFLDPPRQGIGKTVRHALLKIKPEEIVYLSCNPATLARDLRDLAGGGYQMEEILPFDLFPHTYHVETLVFLSAKRKRGP